jgi:hypothetical protein
MSADIIKFVFTVLATKKKVSWYEPLLTLSDPTSNLVRQYDFPVPLWCRKMSDTVLLRLFTRCQSLSDAFPNVVWILANR